MRPRKWTNSDFRAFMAWGGLSARQAADILGVHEATVHRMKGTGLIKDRVADLGMAYLESSKTTKGGEGESIDSWATDDNWADLCEALPLSHVTGLTSAIARGWTSALANDWREVGQPVRIFTPETAAGFRIFAWGAEDMTWGIECRTDRNGRPYRVASAERTIVDLLDHEADVGEADILEALVGAFELSDERPDVRLIYEKARERGPHMEERLYEYVQKYLTAA